MDTQQTEERPHAERSSSSLPNLALCPAYRPRKQPKTKHWVIEQGLRGHSALEDESDEDLNSDFEAKMVAACRVYCAALPKATEVKEERVETIEGRWGYVDLLRFHENTPPIDDFCDLPTVADIVDYKFSKVKEVADAEINLQGKDYAVGVFDKYSFIETVHVHFLMPRFGTVTKATFTRAQLPELKLEILAILTQAKRTDSKRYRGATLNPNYETCRFCGALSSCKAVRKIADTIGRKYDPEGYAKLPPVPEETHASLVDSPATLGQLKKLAAVMEPWAASVSHHCTTAALDKGVVAEGYEIDYRKGKRSVSYNLDFLLVCEEFGVTAEDVVALSKISVTGLESLVRDRSPEGLKSKNVAAFQGRLENLGILTRAPETATLVKQ